MTIFLKAKSKLAWATLTACSSACLMAAAVAQVLPITDAQRSTANEVAQKGLALSELAANAPERYSIKSGDSLWAVSKLYLKNPWRWPELWGMNLEQIKNPHRIFPGQVLVLERSNGRASLRVDDGASLATEDVPTVRVSPRKRIETLADSALPTLRPSAIEPFLAEALIVEEAEFLAAPRIVSAQEGRVLLTRGDRAYARGQAGAPLLDDQAREKLFRVFRTATPLKDPETGAVLGYEAIYAGKARLMSGESTIDETDADGKPVTSVVPARIDITSAKEEIRVGDRLLTEPPRQVRIFTPHAPTGRLSARIVSVYGSAVENAAQNQVVVINKGSADAVDAGTVLAILKNGARVVDKEDATHPTIKLPDERIGLLMVFRSFEKLSYALILEISDGVRVGDRLQSPR